MAIRRGGRASRELAPVLAPDMTPPREGEPGPMKTGKIGSLAFPPVLLPRTAAATTLNEEARNAGDQTINVNGYFGEAAPW